MMTIKKVCREFHTIDTLNLAWQFLHSIAAKKYPKLISLKYGPIAVFPQFGHLLGIIRFPPYETLFSQCTTSGVACSRPYAGRDDGAHVGLPAPSAAYDEGL